MKLRMRKNILLLAVCMVMAIITTSCSSDLADDSGKESKEEMLTLTVTAGSEATRAVLKALGNGRVVTNCCS